ncbi:DUF547 domain-containing protein [Algisphaera agarilytica]|uniref:DUF547 domain-containing protein n=1 Tax=Algisphaera agarilytica TaxID=1385975 RepID=A0A7X0H9B6_9BACT|nr:DUF547 domain-containing protein [Algisphaera agarilytica]MBB6431667.1 hypothetical protein [Algisphaera agarilytica]
MQRFVNLPLTAVILAVATLLAPSNSVAEPSAFDGYDALLKAHVDDAGFVDYDALHAEPEALRRYVDSLADPEALPLLDQPEARLATLINAYNAFTLQLILDNYNGDEAPQSITDLHGGKPWDQEIWNLAGRTLSLNQLEHEIIRKQFDEPRIHWAVVCAAYSCPPLRAEAYTADRLEEQLAEQEAYVLNFNHPRYAVKQQSGLAVTKLFEWYGQDFGPDWKAYATERLGVPLTDQIQFVSYDWKLNSKANAASLKK